MKTGWIIFGSIIGLLLSYLLHKYNRQEEKQGPAKGCLQRILEWWLFTVVLFALFAFCILVLLMASD